MFVVYANSIGVNRRVLSLGGGGLINVFQKNISHFVVHGNGVCERCVGRSTHNFWGD